MKTFALLLALLVEILLLGCGSGGDKRNSREERSKSPEPDEPISVDVPEEGNAFTVPGASLQMLWCPPGAFHMGSPENEKSRDFDEVLREVTLTNGFWLGKHEVTQGQWEKVMGTNPSHFKGSQLPVEKISWDEANAFCEKLTEHERTAGRLHKEQAYQLPTEAQWEYACRAGTRTAWTFGDSPSGLSRYANFSDKKSNLQGADNEYDDGFEFTAPVASYSANAWGFHEMHGNVFEWCKDWYGKHTSDAVVNPVGPSIGKERIFRGGSWALPGVFTRSARRDKNQSILKSGFLGFRLCLGLVQDKE